MLAATDGGGLWRSIDSGATWSRVGTDVLGSRSYTVADDGATFYAGTGYKNILGAVYASSDGATWTKIGLDGQAGEPGVSPSKGQSGVGLPTDLGVFVTSDKGKTFTNRSGGLPTGARVLSLDVDDDFVWAGTESAGAFRAPAAAGDFAALSTGLPAAAYVRALKAVKSGATTTSILAAIDNGGPMGQGEVYEQSDGATWVIASLGFYDAPQAYKRVDEFFQLGATVYAGGDFGTGVYSRAAAPGSTWSSLIGTAVDNYNMLALAASSDGTRIFLGNFGEGVLTGPVGGNTWSRTNSGLLAQRVYTLAAGKAGATDALFAGTEASTAFGVASTAAAPGRTARTASRPASSGASTPSARTSTPGTDGAGIYFSGDGGSSWQLVNGSAATALGSLLVVALAHDAAGVEYAGTQGGGVFKQIGTAQWAPVNVGLTDLGVDTLLMAPDGHLYAGSTAGSMGFVLSGDTWSRLGSGPPAPSRVLDQVWTPAGALCATFGPLACMASPSPTGTWQILGGGQAGGSSLTVADGLLYMGGYGNLIERLDLAGPCWRPEIPLDTSVFRLLTTPTSIIAATNNGLLVQTR